MSQYFRDRYQGAGAIAANARAPRSAPAPTISRRAARDYGPLRGLGLVNLGSPGELINIGAGGREPTTSPILQIKTSYGTPFDYTTTRVPTSPPLSTPSGSTATITPFDYTGTRVPQTAMPLSTPSGSTTPIRETSAPVVANDVVIVEHVTLPTAVPSSAPRSKLPLLLIGGGILALILLGGRSKKKRRSP